MSEQLYRISADFIEPKFSETVRTIPEFISRGELVQVNDDGPAPCFEGCQLVGPHRGSCVGVDRVNGADKP